MHSQCLQPAPLSISRSFPSPQKDCATLKHQLPAPCPCPWQPACAFSLCDAACCRVGVNGLMQDSLLVSGWSHRACPPASSLCRVGCPLLGARVLCILHSVHVPWVYSTQCTCSGYTHICSGHLACSHHCHSEGCCCGQSRTSIF